MPSPFPGMDPYIEASGYFSEFHTSLVVAIRDELNLRLPEGYAATLEVYVWVREPEAPVFRRREPDVYIQEEAAHTSRRRAATAVADPLTITLAQIERKKRKYIKIEDLHLNRVVTAIELLSPSNKAPGDDREVYLAKRREYLASQVNFVEIDLLRGGKRMPLSKRPPPIDDYCVMVCRSWQFPRAGIWTFTIRDPLPDLPIPVTQEFGHVELPLAACMDRVYDGARFAAKNNYDAPLTPALRKSDVAWVRSILAARSSEKPA
jgi:hypothetical protein